MKYLKEYSHEFYYEITSYEFHNLINGLEKDYNPINLSDSEFNSIKKSIKTIDSNIIVKSIESKNGISGLFFKKMMIHLPSGYSFFIDGLKDEWYLCTLIKDGRTFQYYKCDQLEGIVKLLKTIYEIH